MGDVGSVPDHDHDHDHDPDYGMRGCVGMMKRKRNHGMVHVEKG